MAIHAAGTEEEKAEAVARTLAAVDTLERALADAEQRTRGKEWFGGDGVGFVDLALRVRAGDTGVGADDGTADRGHRQDSAAGGVGGPVLRARRGQGGHADGRPPRGNGQDKARSGTTRGGGSAGGKQLMESVRGMEK